MEETIADILKQADKGTVLYSPICGNCILDHVTDNNLFIEVESIASKEHYVFDNEGFLEGEDGVRLLFPSSTNRDWSSFIIRKKIDYNTLLGHYFAWKYKEDEYTVIEYFNPKEWDEEEKTLWGDYIVTIVEENGTISSYKYEQDSCVYISYWDAVTTNMTEITQTAFESAIPIIVIVKDRIEIQDKGLCISST